VIIIAETICILAGMLPLAAGYFQADLPLVAIICLVIGLLWLLSQWRRLDWTASLGMLVFTSASALGVWVGLSPFLLAISVLGSLLAWDLADFSRRLRRAAPEDDLRPLEKQHLIRLAGLGGLSLVLTLAALIVRLQVSFGWLFLLAIVAVLGLLQLVKRLRQNV
jgi:hypothetical protein